MPQVATQAADVEGQSPATQQFPFPLGMQTPEHSWKPLAQVVLHRPAPAQVKFPPHDAAAGGMHEPPRQAPAPMTLPVVEQLARLHPAVVA